jgi:hypothetical protein
MNYNKLYIELLAKYGVQSKPKEMYVERHHIVPKSIGGTNTKENLVYIPARVHFICHRLLCKIYKESDKLKFAFWAMCNQLHGDVTREYKVTSKVFEEAKKEFALANSRLHTGKKISEEHRKALSIKMKGHTINAKGEANHLYGVPRSEEVKAKISETLRKNPTNNNTFKGFYVTPFGKFYSAIEAERVTGISQWFFRRMCFEPDKPITGKTLKNLHQNDKGKIPRELGYSFEPVNSF